MSKRVRLNLRLRLAESQNWHCAYCGTIMTLEKYSADSLTADHVIPASQGGRAHYDNCVACCQLCNQLKKASDAYNFYEMRCVNKIWKSKVDKLRKRLDHSEQRYQESIIKRKEIFEEVFKDILNKESSLKINHL